MGNKCASLPRPREIVVVNQRSYRVACHVGNTVWELLPSTHARRIKVTETEDTVIRISGCEPFILRAPTLGAVLIIQREGLRAFPLLDWQQG